MRSLLLSALAMTVFLAACSKEPSPPVKPPTPKVTEPAPVGAMSDEDKKKAMEAAQDAAKAAGRKGE